MVGGEVDGPERGGAAMDLEIGNKERDEMWN
jgi:hypothetical protein